MQAPEAPPAALTLITTVVGVRPWLPWPLSRWRWWTEPVPAERAAALRLGIAAVLLLDLLLTYLPHAADYFTSAGIGGSELFGYLCRPPRWRWSLLYGIDDPTTVRAALFVWAGVTAGLLVGLGTRLCAVACWVLSVSFANVNGYVDNAGDQIRTLALFYLMLTPCGAAWSLDAWLLRRLKWRPGRVLLYPWALRLLFVQMTFIYFCNGFYKLFGVDWQSGVSLYYVLGDLTLARLPFSRFHPPFWATQVLSYSVLAWEVGFPLWVALPWTRTVALWFGVFFHVGIWASLEIGGFAPYMICLYLPLVPWERRVQPPRELGQGG